MKIFLYNHDFVMYYENWFIRAVGISTYYNKNSKSLILLTSIVRPYSFVITYTKGIQDGWYIDIAEHATPTGAPENRTTILISKIIKQRKPQSVT